MISLFHRIPGSRPGALRMALLALPMAVGCTGSIGPFQGGDGKGTPPSEGSTPPGVYTPPPPPPHTEPAKPLPDDAPTSGFIASVAGPSSRFLRLSHAQWENTVRDLLKLPAEPGLSKQFLNEGVRSHFDNQGGELEVTNQLWFDYNKAANGLATKVARDSKMLATLLAPGAAADVEGRARAFIKSFGERAYRRPLADAEVESYMTLYRKGPMAIGSGDAFIDGLELVISTMLQSPHFLYRIETSTEVKNGRVALTDYEIASRLSYGIVRSMPDEQLFAAAGGKQLRSREAVLSHARRLLDTPAGQATVRDLHTQLIRDADPTELVRDAKLHPNYKPGIGTDLKRETLSFVEEIIFARKQGVRELMTANYTYVNARTAPLYGLQPPSTNPADADKMIRVDLDPTQRAGLYTQIGFLAVTGTDFNPRPIKRGVYMSENVLCKAVPPPPPEVNDPSAPTLEGRTNRQNFEAATEVPNSICIGCHQAFINPLGFAFENYDGFGNFRKDEKGKPVDSSGTYEFEDVGRKNFNNAVDLIKLMAEGKQAHECYSQRLFEYVYGRAESEAEKSLIQELGRRSRLNVPIKNLVLDLVATDAFLTRAP